MPETPLPTTIWRALLRGWTWRMAWRDSRTERQRLALFAASIVIGIAGLVAVHTLKDSVERAVNTQAKSLLGADLQVTARQPFPPEALEIMRADARRVSHEIGFASMLLFPQSDSARMVQARGFSGDYPFYGEVETLPATAWRDMLEGKGILVEPAMLDQFRVKIGDAVKLGQTEFPIIGVILKGAPRSGRFSGFAPEVMVQLSQLEGTGLLGMNSLTFHHAQMQCDDARGIRSRLETAFPDSGWRFETPEDRQESLEKTLDHFQNFLGILALIALVLGAIGVAGAIHAQVSRRIPSVAILRCLGCPAGAAFAVYFAQAMLLGLGGTVIGAGLGVTLHGGTVLLFQDALPMTVAALPRWDVALVTSLSGMLVCWAFALLPLLRVREIPPSATLRESGAEATQSGGRAGRFFVWLLLAGSLFLLTSFGARDWKQALGMTLGLAVAFAVLALTARLLMFLARRMIRPWWPYLLRQGVSNLYRPRNQTLLFLLSLGLGAFLLLTIVFARDLLFQRIAISDVTDSPSVYLVDVQPDQAEGVKMLLAEQGLRVLQQAPMVTMRLRSVKGMPVDALRKEGRIPSWVLQREYRSTYRAEMSATETLIAGAWHEGDFSGLENVPVSLERDLAKDLGVDVGDEIALDVQGLLLSARVTSLREVDWSRFGLNFFMVFPPGVLEGAPGFQVLTTRIPDGQSSGALQRSLVEKFPNVSAIDLAQVLETVRSMLDKIGNITQVLAGFSLIAGALILAGTLLNGRDQRLRESVLLRTLGASSRQVRVILLIEYAVLGILAALTGMFLAILANFLLATRVFEAASPWPNPTLLWLTPLLAALLSISAGILFSHRASKHPPLELLRGRE